MFVEAYNHGMQRVLLVIFCVVAAVGIALVLSGRENRRGYGNIVSAEDQFKDQVQSNATPSADALQLTFVDLDGAKVAVDSFRGKQNVVLVFTRGFPGFVCPYCSAQTSRLIAQHEEFVKRNAAVLVVFPGPKDHVQDFIETSRRQAREKGAKAKAPIPFPILLDVDFAAVDQLGLRDDLAKPSTYIFDRQGELRFAYVGSNSSDRPSIKAILGQLDGLASE